MDNFEFEVVLDKPYMARIDLAVVAALERRFGRPLVRITSPAQEWTAADVLALLRFALGDEIAHLDDAAILRRLPPTMPLTLRSDLAIFGRGKRFGHEQRRALSRR